MRVYWPQTIYLKIQIQYLVNRHFTLPVLVNTRNSRRCRENVATVSVIVIEHEK
jgi:hypothetical protein